ncbi:MAG: GtrA family protein [Cohnella sp.]|nr:GtrA family protein [Cohnella sp.]
MAKYALVGIVNTGVDFAVFCALVYAAGLGSALSQTISYGAAIANSYVWNRVWTFQVKQRQHGGAVIRFVIVNALSFAAATAVLLGLEQAGLEAAMAKACSVGVSLVVNYAGYKLWVFRGDTPGSQAG